MPPEGKSKGKSRKTSKVRKKTTPKEKTLTIPRLDQPGRGLDKMPSNAPTMAIAPSDYEHIFHEGPATAVTAERDNERQKSPSPQPASPPPPPPPSPRPQPMFGTPDFGHQPQGQSIQATNDIQVTPDGYTYLGQQPIDPSNSVAASRRTALPPHVVRANNQFSRAALARIAKFLAGRGEGY